MIKNILKVLMSNAFLAVMGIGISFLFPVILSKNDYAYYQKYALYITYLNICHLGIPSGMYLNYAGKKKENINRSIYKSEVYLMLLVLLLFLGVGIGISLIQKSIFGIIISLSIIPICVFNCFLSLYQAWEKFTAYSIINLLPKIGLIVCTLIIYFSGFAVLGLKMIIIYLIIYWIIAFFFLTDFYIFTRGNKSDFLFSKNNINTAKDGLLLTLGNYINILFHSVDKQFVLLFFSTESFAVYSFAMTVQSVMTVFISALSTPFYPRLARTAISKREFCRLKEWLLMFGSYSGCVYFIAAFFIRQFIADYIDSIEIIALFFLVFPAMSVINVIYINLYKIQHKLREYFFSLIFMLVIAVLFNSAVVFCGFNYKGVTIATVVVYYIWLLYFQKDLAAVSLNKKDCIYLVGYIFTYLLSIYLFCKEIVGLIIYGVIITGWNYTIYKKSLIDIVAFFSVEVKKRLYEKKR